MSKFKSNNNNVNAYYLGSEWHRGQVRKYTGEPYFNHCIDVAQTFVSFITLDKFYATLIPHIMYSSCLLHDTKEDCIAFDPNKVVEECGQEVLDLVNQLTNPSKGSTKSRSERKKMDRDHLTNVSKEAKIIKLIDRTCNLSDMHLCPDKDFISLYCHESNQLLEALNGTNDLLEFNLERTIKTLWHLKK